MRPRVAFGDLAALLAAGGPSSFFDAIQGGDVAHQSPMPKLVRGRRVPVTRRDYGLALASAIATYERNPTRKNRRKVAIARRKASVRAS